MKHSNHLGLILAACAFLLLSVQGKTQTIQHTQQPVDGTQRGHNYVDMGLSVKWATCNIGADNPSDYGDYFAWGETEPKSKYSEANSLTYKKNFINVSGPQYDAAQTKWGGTWRMPSEREFNELQNNSTFEWTTLNGNSVVKVTSKRNGNFIYLPAAGYRYGSSLYGAGNFAGFWTSTYIKLSSGHHTSSYIYYFQNNAEYRNLERYHGLSIRPVCP